MDNPDNTPVEKSQKPLEHDALPTQKWYNKGVNKSAPGSATNTENPGANHRGRMANMSVSQIPEWVANKDIAVSFLEFAAQDYANAKDMRIFYAQAARAHGVTYREIAEIYGVTDSAIQMMLKRAGDK